MDVRFKSYEVVDNYFNYVELVNGIEVSKRIPLYINGLLNPETAIIANQVNTLSSMIMYYKKHLKDDTPHMDFYKSIKNPLDDKEVIAAIVNSYDYDNKSGLYEILTHAYSGCKQFKARIVTSDRDEVYASLFNRWKHNILRLYKDGSFKDGSKYLILAEKLSKIDDIKTYKDYLRCLNDNFMLENSFASIGNFSGWEHFASKYIEVGSNRKLNKLDHRFYINIEGIALYSFINIFLKKCYEKKLPYYFKFDESCSRDDTLVIYSDTSHFLSFLNILNDMEKEYPEFIKYCEKPPILTGRVNSYVGYGSEPDIDGKTLSFNEVREKVLSNAIMMTIDEWLRDKINSGIEYMGRQIRVSTLLAEVGSSQIFNYYKELYCKYRDTNHLEYFYNFYGLSERDFTGSSLKLVLYETIKRNIVNIVNDNNYINTNQSNLVIKTRNNKCIILDERAIYNMKRGIIKYIFTDDVNLFISLRRNIDLLSKMNEIDISKFCFDERIKDKFILQDKYLKKRREISKDDSM